MDPKFPDGHTTIRVSKEVFYALRGQGRMGERMDDVLRRILNLKAFPKQKK